MDSWIRVFAISMDWQDEPGRLGRSMNVPSGPGIVHGFLQSRIAVRR